jgi:deoxycytidine triphosphate deaminase
MMLHIMSSDTGSTLTEVEEQDIQPNAVDLKVAKIFKVLENEFKISNDEKNHRGSVEVKTYEKEDGEWWFLYPGTYEIIMENIISVGDDEAGWVITRSTLNRNGVFITSGLYDSGYHGVMAGALHITTGPMWIKKGTRVGQFLLFKSQALKKYDGDYGIGKAHDQKYGV